MIKEIREFYNISQGQLAAYLKIGRTHLSMAEINQRPLSTAALLTLARIYTATQEQEGKSEHAALRHSLVDQQKNYRELVENELARYHYRLLLLQRSLLKMQKEQERSVKILKSLETLRSKTDNQDDKFINTFESEAREKQQVTGLDEQLKLELEMEGIRAKIAFLEKFKS